MRISRIQAQAGHLRIGVVGKALLLLLLWVSLVPTSAWGAGAFDAKNPRDSGMRILWSDYFKNPNTIDNKNTLGSGFKWYLHHFYGIADMTTSMYHISGGILTLTGCPNNFSYGLCTAAPCPTSSQHVVGTVFKDTAPMYIEWRCAEQNYNITNNKYGWPGIWENSLIGMLQGPSALGETQAMPGNPGKVEDVENDLLELNHSWGPGENSECIHDWVDGDHGRCINGPGSSKTDLRQYHTYGCYLVPATAANGWHGSKTYYFDGVAQGTQTWAGNQDYSGGWPMSWDKLTANGYMDSQLDHEWQAILLGTDSAGITNFYIRFIRVWGTDPKGVAVVDASGNITYGGR